MPAAERRRPGADAGLFDGHGGDITRMSSVDLSRRRPAGPLARQMLRRVDRYLGRGFPTGALRYLRAQKAEQRLRRHDFADAMARVARGYFVFSKDREALEAAQISLAASDGQFVLANWTAAWRPGARRLPAASSYFGNLDGDHGAAGGPRGGRLLGVAGAFDFATTGRVDRGWSPRPQSRHSGSLARRNFQGRIRRWDLPALRQTAVARVASHPNGRRALLDPGRPRPARRAAFAQNGGRRRDRTLADADDRRPPQHARPVTLGGHAAWSYGRMSHAGMYPVPDWRPENGFNVDQALLLAIARQESRFNVRAKSGRGARGLMQLMPRTAAFIGARRALRRDRAQTLFEPRMNMSLAQKYITHLLRQKQVDGDLFRVLAAYNAGPGSLSRWLKAVDFRNDPLLFIEAIPSPETRNYIERVLTNLRMYRLQ